MVDCEKTDCYGNICSGPSGGTRSEPNHILEINESHADNFLLVIPRLPTARYLSTQFRTLTQVRELFGIDYTCPAIREYYDIDEPDTPGTTGTTGVGTTGTTGVPDESPLCQSDEFHVMQMIRENNLDLMNFRLYVSDANFPTTSINAIPVPTQFATMNRASKIEFGDLTTTMLVSENFLNYNALLFWLYALHNPEEYAKIYGRQMIQRFFVEMHLIITDNHRNKVAEYKFIDAFPNTISDLTLSYKNADKLAFTTTWKHSGMLPDDNFVLRYV
jgi:hypothetical protein